MIVEHVAPSQIYSAYIILYDEEVFQISDSQALSSQKSVTADIIQNNNIARVEIGKKLHLVR